MFKTKAKASDFHTYDNKQFSDPFHGSKLKIEKPK